MGGLLIRALITGITGQDGWYLTRFLTERGYDVHGTARNGSCRAAEDVRALAEDRAGSVTIHEAALGSATGELIRELRPDEIYHLAAPSRVAESFDRPVETMRDIGLCTAALLEAARSLPNVKVYNSSSSEMYGRTASVVQDETTPFDPVSPYAAAKLAAHFAAVAHRRSFDQFVSNGILFNHDSPRRHASFVTRKISLAAARIAAGQEERLVLGNTAAERDFGFAGDYVEAMWLMLQHDRPDDFVIATGVSHSISDIVEVAFGIVGLDPAEHVEIDETLVRPTDIDRVCGDTTKARRELGWAATVAFEDLIEMMVEADVARLRATAR